MSRHQRESAIHFSLSQWFHIVAPGLIGVVKEDYFIIYPLSISWKKTDNSFVCLLFWFLKSASELIRFGKKVKWNQMSRLSFLRIFSNGEIGLKHSFYQIIANRPVNLINLFVQSRNSFALVPYRRSEDARRWRRSTKSEVPYPSHMSPWPRSLPGVSHRYGPPVASLEAPRNLHPSLHQRYHTLSHPIQREDS